ncbi:integral membrane sensor signal transduction histidine kinase [Denitrovibrio acetiphilus DSM 12809]|uniref:histidine kinase n=1 Tax=Denitrovibrio acetiphilus (strain DSM 12809 / NBRC 114555 / N2460) TaxID=522772 RepID=D4H8R4_DENA2|nr:HAMP domain-containing sensor histidine kinase [Denitrovibrio acetiphilus]ADD68413.1 integral membrane sensor signal transduction histidine kinase [Denitrovibrio acetiphilus DSM 12809]
MMKAVKSLRIKIIMVFAGFSFLLGFALLMVILIATQYTEEYTLKKRLHLETERYVKSIVSSPVSPGAVSYEAPVPKSSLLTSYIGDELLPEWAYKELSSLPEGEYKKQHDNQIYYITISNLANHQRFYLIYNVTTMLSGHENIAITRKYFMLTLFPTFFIGLLLGIITAYKAVSPVIRLSSIIKKAEQNNTTPENFSADFGDDETGFLARTLEHSIKGMQSSIDREKAFARDASHELRTPVAIINGAASLLQKELDESDEKKLGLLARINRANKTMEHLINSFLWLSRQEKYHAVGASKTSVVVKEVVENMNYLVQNKPIEIIVEELEESILPVTPPILSILVGNLLRNAISYTVEGSVVISIYEKCIAVKDTGPGIPKDILNNLNIANGVPQADGFGFGLSIVHRICSHIGWKLMIDSEEMKGSTVVLCSRTPNKKTCLTPCKKGQKDNTFT